MILIYNIQELLEGMAWNHLNRQREFCGIVSEDVCNDFPVAFLVRPNNPGKCLFLWCFGLFGPVIDVI